MPPRSSMSRARSKSIPKAKHSGKNLPGTPFSTLQDILRELGLSFDSSVGLLNGDNIRNVPNIPSLLNLQKLLDILSSQLEYATNTDAELLKSINSRFAKNDEEDDVEIEENEDLENEVEESFMDSTVNNLNNEESTPTFDSVNSSVIKREHDESEEPNDSIILKKRRIDEEVNTPIENDDEEEEERERLNSNSDPVPPVQTASFTPEHDTRLVNPKSEFVTSQTLPPAAHELGLFTEEDGGLEHQGVEYYKRKYGVASYPTRDLKDMLPGKIPNIDFSKNKPPTNQVQFTTYQSYIEPFFRTYGEEDLSFLKQKSILPSINSLDSNYDPNLSPFMIPKLGPLYTDVWAMEDQSGFMKLSTPPQQTPESVYPKGSIDDLNDDTLYSEDISCGPLSSRLLSAILKDDSSEPSAKLGVSEDYKVSSTKNDYQSLEERLKRELKYIGIFMNVPGPTSKNNSNVISSNNNNMNNPNSAKNSNESIDNDWMLNREDDEVSAEIRALQKELKAVVLRNNKRKKRILPIVEEQIAWQEYSSILEDLDKQTDQAYIKRNKGSKHRKKKGASNSQSNSQSQQPPTPAQLAQQAAANSGLRTLLDKRENWISKIGPLFKPPELMKRVPSESVFKDLNFNEDNDDDDAAEDEDNDESNGGSAVATTEAINL